MDKFRTVRKNNKIIVHKYRYASLNDGGNVLRNASLNDFVVVRKCTYTNLESTV